MPTGPRHWGSVLQEFHRPLPLGIEAEYCTRSTAHCPQALGQCIAGGPLPLPPGSEAEYCRRSTAHYPQAVTKGIAGVPLPNAPRQ